MAAIGGIFIITLIIVSIITVKISDLILDSRIGALDRTLGFVFGAARGFLICVIGWIFLGWLLQGKNPEWATTSRTRPMLENTGNNLIAMLPDNPEGLLQQLRKREAPTPTRPSRRSPTRSAARIRRRPPPPRRAGDDRPCTGAELGWRFCRVRGEAPGADPLTYGTC